MKPTNKTVHKPIINSLRLCALLAVCATSAVAQVGTAVISLKDTNGDPGSGTVVPGETFTLCVFLTSDQETFGLTYFLETLEPGCSGRFQIEGRNTTNSIYTDVTNSNSSILAPTNALLDPRTGSPSGAGGDLGANSFPLFAPPNIEQLVACFTIKDLGGPEAGFCTIQVALKGVTGRDANGDPYDLQTQNIATTNYRVEIVPEPSVPMLLCFAAAFLGAARRKGIAKC